MAREGKPGNTMSSHTRSRTTGLARIAEHRAHAGSPRCAQRAQTGVSAVAGAGPLRAGRTSDASTVFRSSARRAAGRTAGRPLADGRQQAGDQRITVILTPGDGDSCPGGVGFSPAEGDAFEADASDARRGQGHAQTGFHEGAHGLPLHRVLNHSRCEPCCGAQADDLVMQ